MGITVTDKERRTAKYLPFDALKGLKENIEKEDKNNLYEETPFLSEDELLEMNGVLFNCYSKNQAIIITYFEKGIIHHYSGVIAKIDILNEQIILLPKRKFSIHNICKIAIKE